MGTPVKITVIGAGSATFSMGLVRDLCLTEGLSGSHVTLMDIDAERVQRVHHLAERYIQELGGNLSFDWTTRLEDSLRGCDYVINTAGREYAHVKEIVGLNKKHGYHGVVLAITFLNLKPMLNVARAMERVCPDAWLIQSGNPVFEGVTLMTRETGIKIIGLCHGHYGYRAFAKALGVDPDQVTWMAPGLNHNIWLTDFRLEGKDLYSALDQWIENEAEGYWSDREQHPERYPLEDPLNRSVIDRYRRFGLLPVGDTARGGAWWYKSTPEAQRHWYGPIGWVFSDQILVEAMKERDRRFAQIRDLAQDASRSVLEVFPPAKTSEQQVPIIDALTNDVGNTFQINVPNQGAVPGIPDDVVAEMPAYIDKGGIRRLQVQPLPRRIMLEEIHPAILDMEWQLEMFHSGDRGLLLDYMLSIDTYQGEKRTTSYAQAKAYMEDWLAQPFNQDLAEHFQPRQPSWGHVLEPRGK